MTSRLIKTARRAFGGFARLSSTSRPAATIVFLHIPKTGGLSIIATIQRQFPHCATYIAKNQRRAAALEQMSDEELNRFDLVAGHFRGDILPRFKPPRLVFTCLRDPVDRVVSLYDYLRQLPRDKLGEERFHSLRNITLAQFVANPLFRPAIDNAQCRQLIGAAADSCVGIEQLAKQAIRRIAEMDAVFTTAEIDATGYRFLAKAGINVPLQQRNRGLRHMPLNALPDRDRMLIEELTQADRILFEHVNQRRSGLPKQPQRPIESASASATSRVESGRAS